MEISNDQGSSRDADLLLKKWNGKAEVSEREGAFSCMSSVAPATEVWWIPQRLPFRARSSNFGTLMHDEIMMCSFVFYDSELGILKRLTVIVLCRETLPSVGRHGISGGSTWGAQRHSEHSSKVLKDVVRC